MPTTTEKNYNIGVKVTGGTASDVFVNFRNGRTGDTKKVKTETNEAVVDLADSNNFPNGFANADVIEVNISGLRTGGTTHTVDTTKGGKDLRITLTDASTTNAPAISI